MYCITELPENKNDLGSEAVRTSTFYDSQNCFLS